MIAGTRTSVAREEYTGKGYFHRKRLICSVSVFLYQSGGFYRISASDCAE